MDSASRTRTRKCISVHMVVESLFDLPPARSRVCRSCRIERPIEMFYLDSEERQSKKRGKPVYRFCRACQWERNNARLAPRRALLDAIKITAGGCADCGIRNDEHPEIFDFDHRAGEIKEGKVADLVTKGTVEDMLAEAAKCDVVCSNCHRIRTRVRNQTRYDRDKATRIVR